MRLFNVANTKFKLKCRYWEINSVLLKFGDGTGGSTFDITIVHQTDSKRMKIESISKIRSSPSSTKFYPFEFLCRKCE